MHAICPTHLTLLNLITLVICGKEYKSGSSSVCQIFFSLVTTSLLGQNIFLSNMFSKTDSLCSSLIRRILNTVLVQSICKSSSSFSIITSFDTVSLYQVTVLSIFLMLSPVFHVSILHVFILACDRTSDLFFSPSTMCIEHWLMTWSLTREIYSPEKLQEIGLHKHRPLSVHWHLILPISHTSCNIGG